MKIQQDPVVAAAIHFCRECDSEYTRQLASLLEADPASLATAKRPAIDSYSCSSTFARDWAAYNLIRKYPGLPGTTQRERKEKALQAWTSAENSCRITNVRLRSLMAGDNTLLSTPLGSLENSPTLAQAISLAQIKIERILGPFSFKAVTEECRWSGGATFDLRRGSTIHQKMSDVISVTRRAESILRRLLRRDIHWMSSVLDCEVSGPCTLLGDMKVVRGSRLITVPKTAFIERPIAAEPTGNAFLQQGVGRYIRKRLKRATVDLDDQSWNQWLASKAHSHGYSTLDLESASDTVSIALVELLLPSEWVHYLKQLRSPAVRLGGSDNWILLEKFSSMGNGFTFELESLIFYGLASAISELMGQGDANLAVYGDDLIVKRECSESLVNLLAFMGFKTNMSKSFVDGNFFESCGKHYFKGLDVTPANQTSNILGLPDVIRFHNRLYRWSWRVEGGFSKLARSTLRGFLSHYRIPLGFAGYPVIPNWDVSDDGFLVGKNGLNRLPYDINMGYLCNVLVQSAPLRGATQHEQRSLLAYKLRRPGYSNPDRKGQAGFPDNDGRWVRRLRYVPRHIAS